MSLLSLFSNRFNGSSDFDNHCNDLFAMPESTDPDPAGNVDQLIHDRRYCLLLDASSDEPIEESQIVSAWKAMENGMALVPGGESEMVDWIPVFTQSGFDFEQRFDQRVAVRTFYLDRFAVTNEEFARFVAAGGYGNVDLWVPEILQHVLQFVDQTGCPAPRFWRNGQPPADKSDHPVVGICFYEAAAYANWVGKRLPMSGEWQRAGCWATAADGQGAGRRYPWGNDFDPKKANTWAAQRFDTVSVDQYRDGCTPNGIYQLIGNVWEWIDTPFQMANVEEGLMACFEQPMAEIRGGAFDTYFESQANCQFRTAHSLWHRGTNVGFRCCIGPEKLRPSPDPLACAELELCL